MNNEYIKKILLTTVFLTGASVLVIEVAAVRFLSPYFGSSLYVLSSVLTTVMLALAFGYYLGGKLSDRCPYHLPLYGIIGIGGTATLILTCFAVILLPSLGNHLPLLIGPLLFSFLLFFTPAFLLGMDSPYVIKLLSIDTDSSVQGKVVGSTFFWSTAGSIVGSLISGFLLIPVLGLIDSMVLVGVVLLILSTVGGFSVRMLLRKNTNYDTRNDKSVTLPIIVFLIIATVSIYFLYNQPSNPNTVFEKDGFYSKITIVDIMYQDKPTRFLVRDSNSSSAIFLEDDGLVFTYSQFVDVYKDLVPDAENFLLLGGGSYTIPRYVHSSNPNISIDVVDLEPSLFEISKKYFNVPETEKIQNHISDARVYVNRNDKLYDVIFFDAFGSGRYIPNHLVTVEFFDVLKQRLSSDGVLIINFISTRLSFEQSLLGSFSKTLLEVFPNSKLYTTTSDKSPGRLQNLMFISLKGEEEIKIDPNFTVTESDKKETKITELEINPYDLIKGKDTVFRDYQSSAEFLLVKERILF